MTRDQIIPDKLYPLAVYCDLTGRTRLAARDRCRRGLVTGAVKPVGEAQWYVPGSALLAYYRQQEPVQTPATVRATKRKRIQAALSKAIAAV
jgi:hypothetical protein